MIQLSAAGKRSGPKLLFENLNWLITSHDRVGLVRANGTGKSTISGKNRAPVQRTRPVDAYGITVHTEIAKG